MPKPSLRWFFALVGIIAGLVVLVKAHSDTALIATGVGLISLGVGLIVP